MVEGNTDNGRGERLAYDRSVAVKEALVRNGIPAGSISARSAGTAAGDVERDRVRQDGEPARGDHHFG